MNVLRKAQTMQIAVCCLQSHPKAKTFKTPISARRELFCQLYEIPEHFVFLGKAYDLPQGPTPIGRF